MKSQIFLLSACIVASGLVVTTPAAAQDTAYQAIPLKNLDKTVNPAQNFYQFAVGNWIKNNPVPPSKSAWFSFNELFENNKKVLHEVVLSAAAAHPAMGSNTQKIADFFKAGMDSVHLNELGIRPIQPYLTEIDQVKDKTELKRLIPNQIKQGLGNTYQFNVRPDEKNSALNILQFNQGGLGLPDRDYYFTEGKKSDAIRQSYKAHVAKMFELLGYATPAATQASIEVFDLEKSLAGGSLSRVKLRDPYANYHKMSLIKFSRSNPGLLWDQQIAGLGINPQSVDSVNIAQPVFFSTLDSLVKAVPLKTWKNYLRWKLISSSAPLLNSASEQESFNFYGKVLSGTKVMEQRWERIEGLLDRYLGDALGEAYVQKAFPMAAKTRMLSLISNLRAAFAERIKNLDWMSDSTKQKALMKLNAITVKVGYPDKWKDYSTLIIRPGQFFQDVLAARAYAYQYMIHQFGKPVDKTRWGMTPPTVNAYYNPSFNEIVFPAGILQPPFFDFRADDAVNYGGIGAVIGHEMTHGFDDQGRLYDASGNLKNWWSAEDAKQFKSRAEKVVEQFNAYTVLDTVHVNGKLTEGENLADLGGTMIAYQAFKKTPQGMADGPAIDGFTPDQRFFLSFAQVWRGNISPQASALRIVTDPHAPGQWRTIGPMSNNPTFYKAFQVKEGDGMYRSEQVRAKVW